MEKIDNIKIDNIDRKTLRNAYVAKLQSISNEANYLLDQQQVVPIPPYTPTTDEIEFATALEPKEKLAILKAEHRALEECLNELPEMIAKLKQQGEIHIGPKILPIIKTALDKTVKKLLDIALAWRKVPDISINNNALALALTKKTEALKLYAEETKEMMEHMQWQQILTKQKQLQEEMKQKQETGEKKKDHKRKKRKINA